MLEWDTRDRGMLLWDARALETDLRALDTGPLALQPARHTPHRHHDHPLRPAPHVSAAKPGTPACSNGTTSHSAALATGVSGSSGIAPT